MRRMQWTAIWLLAAIPCVLSQAAKPIENAYIIEFHPSDLSISETQSMVLQKLRDANVHVRIRQTFEILPAISVDVLQGSVADIAALGEVMRVSAINKVSLPTTSNSVNSRQPSRNFPLEMMNVQPARTMGYEGQGVKVGVIDTGKCVDYMHPALGGCFGPGCRVAYGYDFAGDAYDGSNTPESDDDPRDTCMGHGTHVSGIIGGNYPLINFTGVAPQVTYGAYRIFGCKGGTADDLIMMAMERAYIDGMDIINMSLGGSGWPSSPTSALTDILSQKGLHIAASAGNDGSAGLFEVGAPSLGEGAISVASVDNIVITAFQGILGDNTTFPYITSNGKPLNVTSGDLVTVDSIENPSPSTAACHPLHQDLSGKIALIKRGGCPFQTMAQNLQNAGARAFIVYNNVPGIFGPSVANLTIQIAGVSAEDGDKLYQKIQSSPTKSLPVRMTAKIVDYRNPTGGTASAFSSWGLSPDLAIKPDIAAPGGQIYSTFPLDLGAWMVMSGTSMSSPQIAGSLALLVQRAQQAGVKLTPPMARTQLMNTAQPFKAYDPSKNQTSHLDTVVRQGSGLVDVSAAVQPAVTVEPRKLALNDTTHGKFSRNLTITNHMSQDSTIQVANLIVPSVVGAQMDDLGSYPPNYVNVSDQNAFVSSPLQPMKVSAGASADFTVTFMHPISPADMPMMYSGYIVIQAMDDNGNVYDVSRVPYAGLSTPFSALNVLHVNATSPSVELALTNQSSAGLHAAVQTHTYSIAYQLELPSRLVIIDVISAQNSTESNTTSIGIVPDGVMTLLTKNDLNSTSDVNEINFDGRVLINVDMSALYSLEHGYAASYKPSNNNTQVLSPGEYNIRIRAWRGFDDVYDQWISAAIEV